MLEYRGYMDSIMNVPISLRYSGTRSRLDNYLFSTFWSIELNKSSTSFIRRLQDVYGVYYSHSDCIKSF